MTRRTLSKIEEIASEYGLVTELSEKRLRRNVRLYEKELHQKIPLEHYKVIPDVLWEQFLSSSYEEEEEIVFVYEDEEDTEVLVEEVPPQEVPPQEGWFILRVFAYIFSLFIYLLENI